MQEQKPLYRIYSRNRMRIFKNKTNNRNNNNKIFYIIIIITIAIITLKIGYNSIEPIFETTCIDEAQAIATRITNEESTKVMANYKYNDMFNIEKDDTGNIQMINANIFVINEITSDIALYIQKALEDNERTKIKLWAGSLTGIKMLSGMGPSIEVNMYSVGNVSTDVRSEFEAKGINQTIHRVYLQIDCTTNILTPYTTIEKQIGNQVLLIENVIIGKIPDSYYNFEGLDDVQSTLDTLE